MTAVIYALVGLAVVVGTSVLKKEKWSVKTKTSISGGLSLVGGFVTTYFNSNGTDTLNSSIQNSAILLALAQLIYTFGLKDTSVNKFLTGLNLYKSGVKVDVTPEQSVIESAITVAKTVSKPKTVKKKA